MIKKCAEYIENDEFNIRKGSWRISGVPVSPCEQV